MKNKNIITKFELFEKANQKTKLTEETLTKTGIDNVSSLMKRIEVTPRYDLSPDKFINRMNLENWSDELCGKFLKGMDDLVQLMSDLKENNSKDIEEWGMKEPMLSGWDETNRVFFWFYQLDNGWRGDDGTSVGVSVKNGKCKFFTNIDIYDIKTTYFYTIKDLRDFLKDEGKLIL